MMASFNKINYSLRPSKTIQRALVFSGVSRLIQAMASANYVYVGFGSIWFSDFQYAHKYLGIDTLISMEKNPIGYRRACFNKPFKTIEVIEGQSSEILPTLLLKEELQVRPWIIWLDYDCALNEEVVDEWRWCVENTPQNSIFITTFSGNSQGEAYGKPKDRATRIKTLLGGVVPDDLSKEACDTENLSGTLADYGLDYLRGVAADSARPGGFIPAFRVPYTDSVPMVTIGGVLPAKGAVPAVREAIKAEGWPCTLPVAIRAPQLTLKETATLQPELPTTVTVDRARIQELGFDLEEHEIEAFCRYYKYIPTFAEIVT